ncbi:MAG: DMT family transporter [Candidatus Peribacteraceae bacterium]|nr:DMT family transporter [Candidatus Peribacteraceae bacterium]
MHTLTALFPRIWPQRRITWCETSAGWLFLFLMVASSSTTATFAKQLGAVFSPLSMLVLSECMMLLFALLSFGSIPLMRSIWRMDHNTLVLTAIAGMLNGIIAPLLWFYGLERTSVINAQLFGMTEMLFMIAFAVFFASQHLTRSHIVGGSIIITGVAFVSLQGFTSSLTVSRGDIAILLSGILFATGGTIVATSLRKIDSELIIVIRSAVAILCFFLLSPFVSHPFRTELAEFPLTLLPILFGYGFISRFLVIFSYYESIERLPVPTVSLLSTLSIAGSALFAFIILGEAVVWYQIVGAALVITGSAFVHHTRASTDASHVVHEYKGHHRYQG